MLSITTQQVVKIVHEELIKILSSHESRLRFANDPPSVMLIVGLHLPSANNKQSNDHSRSTVRSWYVYCCAQKC